MDSNSFDNLVSGLIGSHDEKKNAKQTEKKPEDNKESRFCTILRKDLQKKIRLIALKESLPIKDVVEAALQKAVESYERKYGKVEDDIKGNAHNLF